MDFRVIKIEEDGFVWVSQASIQKLNQLEDSTAALVSRLLPSRSPEEFIPKRGDVCAAFWKEKWRRGVVETLYNSAKYNKIAQVLLLDHGAIVTFPLAELVSLQSSSISIEPPLIMKYQLHPLTASPVNPTEEKPWSEFVEDIFDLLSLTNDSWGYLTKGIVNDDGTIHLFNEGLDVSINDMLKRRGLLHIEEGEDEDFTIQHRIQTNEEIVLTPSPCSSPPPLYIESPNYPLEMTSPQASTYMYMNTLKIPHSPRSASKVYIDGAHNEHVIWSSLEETPFNTSICKELQERGFRSPTSVQSNGWYYVWNGNDTILCSPHHSGKTLSYLLPLLSLSCKREKEEKNSYEPEIIVVADDSYKTWNITDQAKTILTWFDAAKRFRTSFLFATVESDAHIQILNGVDILVATPPALTRLVKREIIAFRSTRHLVLDDLCLFDKFPSEMNDLLSCCIAKGKQTKIPLQLVACSSTYSKNNFNNFLRYSKAPVTVMTDIIEVLAMKKVKMNVLFCEVDDVHKKLLSVLKASSQSGPNVICVSNENEAQKILQVFSLYSFQVNIWRKEDNTHSFRSVTGKVHVHSSNTSPTA